MISARIWWRGKALATTGTLTLCLLVGKPLRPAYCVYALWQAMEGPQVHIYIPNHGKRVPQVPAIRGCWKLPGNGWFPLIGWLLNYLRRYSASLTRDLGDSLWLACDDKAELHEVTWRGYQLVEVIAVKFQFALVELFPILDYLPGFLAPWKVYGKEYYLEAISFYSNNLHKAQSTLSWNWVKQSLTHPKVKHMLTG